jgi:hypothetical protein
MVPLMGAVASWVQAAIKRTFLAFLEWLSPEKPRRLCGVFQPSAGVLEDRR